MLSVPYSRYLIYPIPWYSFLIVLGVVLAVLIACREEKRAGLKKDTVIDLALWLLPGGIIGARIYYVVFSWNQFRDDFLSVFRIWEGGLAIYGAIISGLIVLLVFCRHRGLSPLLLCDLIAPGLALAQSIGRWGNYFNIEAYGLSLSNPSLCFFPLAVRVPADGNAWHMATFFYESVLDFGIFLFLMKFRHSIPHRKGDVFFHYLFLYAAGRLCIEELRTDSLFAVSSVRISQLLSVLISFVLSGPGCKAILFFAACPLWADPRCGYRFRLDDRVYCIRPFYPGQFRPGHSGRSVLIFPFHDHCILYTEQPVSVQEDGLCRQQGLKTFSTAFCFPFRLPVAAEIPLLPYPGILYKQSVPLSG